MSNLLMIFFNDCLSVHHIETVPVHTSILYGLSKSYRAVSYQNKQNLEIFTKKNLKPGNTSQLGPKLECNNNKYTDTRHRKP